MTSRGRVVALASGLALGVALSTGSCGGGGSGKADVSGSPDASTDGASGIACTTDAECASRVPRTTPADCATGKCNSIQGVCVFPAKDEDADGHAAANCKSDDASVTIVDGDDCNDHDPNLYPGHPESCATAEDGGMPLGILCAEGQLTCRPDGTESPCTGTQACVNQACVNKKCVTGCEIGGQLFASGMLDPNNPCETCQTDQSTTSWSPLADDAPCGNGQTCAKGVCGTQCVIGGTVYAPSAANPGNACELCKPGTSASSWSNAADGTACGTGDYCGSGTCSAGCFIAGAFYAAGAANPSNGCQTCQTATSTTSWTTTGADGSSCGTGEVCVMGACRAGCYIGSAFVTSGTQNPGNACQACQPTTSTTAYTDVTGGVCAGGTCCSGKCVDLQTSVVDCGTCGRTCIAGPSPACTSGLCNYTLATGVGGEVPAVLGPVAVDATSVYWANSDWENGAAFLMKVSPAGGTVTTLASGYDYISSLALTATNVYWTCSTSGGPVMKVPLAGGTPSTFAPLQSSPAGVAVDATSVYWTTSAAVLSAPIGGLGAGVPTTLASPQTPVGLAIDATNAYWVNSGAGTVEKVALGGGSTSTLATFSGNCGGLVVDASSVYWVTDAAVQKVSLAGGTVTTLAATPGGQGIAVDASSVYWSDGSGTITKVGLGGGTPTTLAAGQANPGGVAVDGTNVYWVALTTGNVMSTPK